MLININCSVLSSVAIIDSIVNSFKSFVLGEKAAVELGSNVLFYYVQSLLTKLLIYFLTFFSSMLCWPTAWLITNVALLSESSISLTSLISSFVICNPFTISFIYAKDFIYASYINLAIFLPRRLRKTLLIYIKIT
jgi:hypothetical protein